MSANKISTIFFSIDIAPKAHDMGRNLLRGAGLTSLNSITEGGVTFYRINSFADSLVKIVDGVDGNKGVWVKTNSGETNVYRGVFFTAAVNKGETYTLSAWVKGTAGTTLYLEVLNSTGTARKNSDGTASTRYTGTGSFATISDDWRRVTFTFTVDDLNGGYVECNFFTNAVGEFTICEPKLERGDVATAFCLNEADLKGDKGDKGDDGKDGQNGKNAVHYELRDNGSLADITIDDDKIKLTASLNYDLYRVDGTTEAKVTGTVTNNLDGGALSYSNAHYTKTITKVYTDIDSLPATVITTAKVNNTVAATAVCKVSMSKTAYWNVDTQLGKVTSMATDNENHIAALQLEAKRISAKVGSVANPNLLINSGFIMTSNGIPSYWEVWDDNKAQPAVTLNGDNCKIEVNATGMYQGIRQKRKMQLHSPLKLTFSCIAKGSGTLSVMLHKIQGNTQTGDRSDFKLEAGAKSLSCTFELSQYIDAWRVMIGFVSPSVGNNVTFYNPKLEIGDMATQWCENENDRVLATGIDIEERKVTLTADTTLVRSNDGTQIALFGMASKGVPFLNTGLINAETITVNRLLAYNGDTMLTSINKEGNGEFIQYYPDGKKKMEIADGRIIYYNDDAKNSQKWVIGENGTAQSIDNWTVFQLCKTDPDGSNVRTISTLNGDTYSKFHAGENSVNKSYEGLTVFGRQNGTSPTNSGLIKIANGWYTNTGIAFINANVNSSGFATASRTLIEYENGKETGNIKRIEWEDGDVLVPIGR